MSNLLYSNTLYTKTPEYFLLRHDAVSNLNAREFVLAIQALITLLVDMGLPISHLNYSVISYVPNSKMVLRFSSGIFGKISVSFSGGRFAHSSWFAFADHTRIFENAIVQLNDAAVLREHRAAMKAQRQRNLNNCRGPRRFTDEELAKMLYTSTKTYNIAINITAKITAECTNKD